MNTAVIEATAPGLVRNIVDLIGIRQGELIRTPDNPLNVKVFYKLLSPRLFLALARDNSDPKCIEEYAIGCFKGDFEKGVVCPRLIWPDNPLYKSYNALLEEARQ